MEPTRPLSEADLVAVATVASSLSRLNAVPNAEWAMPASRMLSRSTLDAVTSVTVADFDDLGVITHFLSIGAAAPSTIRQDQLLEFTDSKGGLSSLNWWIKTATATVVVLRDLESNKTWTTSRAGKAWSRLGVGHLLVGVAKVPGPIDARYAIVEIGFLGGAEGPTDADASRLRALLPILTARVQLAFNTPETRDTMVTARELEVLDRLTLGRSVKQIATELDRSEHTIHDHVKSLHRKLGATSRGELIGRALGHVASAPATMNQAAVTASSGTEIRIRRTSVPTHNY